MELRKTLFRLMLASLAVSALIGVVGVFADGGEVFGQLLGTIGLLAVAVGLAVASLEGAPVDRRGWRWLGVAAAGAAWVVAIPYLWIYDGLPALALAGFVLGGIALIVAHANLSLLCPLKPRQRWLRVGTIVSVILTFVLTVTVIAIYSSFSPLTRPAVRADAELLARAAMAMAIPAACGSAALLVLAWLNRRITTPPTIPGDITAMAVVCPWCQKQQTLAIGESKCAGCGMKFRIEVEEPRCPKCNYLLYMLTGDRCPECGTPIGATV